MDDRKLHTKTENLDFYNQNAIQPSVPVQVNLGTDDVNFFTEPLPQNQPAPLEQPYGFFQNIWHGGTVANTLHSAYEFGQRKIQDLNPIDDYVAPNYKVDPNEAMDGIDPRSGNYVMAATGPKDLLRRRNYVLDHQEENRRIANGSKAGLIAGGFTLGALDPTSLIPIAKGFKYAKMSQSFIQALPRVLPGAELAAISREGILQTTKTDGSWEEFFHDAYADTVMNTIFMAGIPGVAAGADAMKAFNAKGVIKMINKGIEPRPVLDEKGVVKGWKAAPMDSSVGAAEVDMAQAYLDGAMAKNSLYSIPYLGEKIGYAAGRTGQVLGGWLSPQVRMANSTYSTLRGLIYHVADNGFESEGVAQGREKPDTFQADYENIRERNKGIKNVYDGLYMEFNGITYDPETAFSRTRANIEAKVKAKTQQDWKDRATFGRAVQYVMISKKPHESNAVNEAARLFEETQKPVYQEWLKLNGISEKVFTPRTSDGYATRAYNHPFLVTDAGEEAWIREASIELEKYDNEINALVKPIENAKAEHKRIKAEHEALIRRGDASNEQVKASADNLLASRRFVKRLQESVQDQIRNDHNLHIHAEDLNAVSATEAKQIKKLRKPIKDLEAKVAEQQAVIDKLSGSVFFKEEAANKAKTAEGAKKNAAKVDAAKKQLESEKVKLTELKDKRDQAKLDLEDKLASGAIDQSLYVKIKESNRYALKDEKNRLKLRPVHESHFHRQQVAKAQYDSIMNNTSEDLINNVLYGFFPSMNPNPVKARSIMYRDKFLYDNNFLHPDPVISVMNYNLALGRKNAYKRMLNRITVNGTPEELVERLKGEHEAAKAAIRSKNLDDKKREKEIAKENKRFKAGQEDLKNTLNKIQGFTKGGPKARAYTSMANLFAVATKLGFLPFTMSTDLMANVFKHGFWPFIHDGLVPMLQGLGGVLNTEAGKAIRENAAHALLAENHLALTYADRNWMGGAQDYTPIQGKLTNGMERLAHYSMNFSGANFVQNANERWSALIIQGKIMSSMEKFLKDELKEGSKDYKDLLKYGIDPKTYAERFMNGWKETGKAGIGFGSKLAKYWEWTDLEAANKMSRAINRAVKDVVIRRGMFDAPFAMDDPLINSLFLFKGYTFASLNRYLVPLLQKPEADKLIGTMFMLTVGATQNPLRRIIAGQDPVEEKDHMLRNAIRDGGVFSILGDTYQDLNFLTSNFFQDLVNNPRYQGRLEMGVFNGPIGGMVNDTSRIIGMTLSREWNQTDLKRMATLVPFAYSWQFRGLANKMIAGTNFPKTRQQAHKLKESGV